MVHNLEQPTISEAEVAEIYNRAYEFQSGSVDIMGTRLIPGYNETTKTWIAEHICGANPDYPVLDIGAGDGDLVSYVKEYCPDHGYVAFDISHKGLSVARDRFRSIECASGSMFSLPFDSNSFGAVVLADALEHSPCIQSTLSEINRVLIPGGRLAISVPTQNSINNMKRNLFAEMQVGRLAQISRAALVRTYLFGNANFQPIDAGLSLDVWVKLISEAGFCVEKTDIWPCDQKLRPVVQMIKAVKI